MDLGDCCSVPVPRPRPGRSVRGVVRRGHGGRGYRGGQDSAAVSSRELLRRTLRVDRPHRGHRPDADLRPAAPTPGACRIRRPLQRSAAAPCAAVAAAAPDIAGPRADSWQDPASTDPRRPDQSVRGCGLKPLIRRHGRVLAPDTPTGRSFPRPSRRSPTTSSNCSPSTTTPPSTGSTCAPRTRSRAHSPPSGTARRSPAGPARGRLAWRWRSSSSKPPRTAGGR